LQETLHLSGLELYEELREKQARMCQKLCLEFLEKFPTLSPKAQSGEESFYPKRTPKDSELDINQSLESQFNLLRIASNEEFPAFFVKNGKKFVLKIYAYDSGGGGGIIPSLCLELENYIHLQVKAQEEILQYRNDVRVKSNLYHQHHISSQEHFAFIESLKNNPNKQYFVVRFYGQMLGSLNFSFQDKKSVEFGFFANPCLNVSGIGRVLEQISLFYVFKILGAERLYLEVFKSNKQVINLHRKFGFQENGEKRINGKEVLEMSIGKHCK
ncbi:UDP-4-amino-4,6-dideoxy-N-acetyl-beta-L-altrosamine N-acetyltransferase, partial [Helicobacter ganmani]|uniref:UDP-4-amino-4, 6-dideoxy-N-acetyl-beta-L-altrosamine N-acetyltransferase n=1 Tax=Helicobacter ganmani TaxID=60246 RepID=UPI003A86CF4B